MDPTFQERLVEVRAKLGLTQAQLAEKTGLQPAAISHFETGFRFPTAATLTKLAEALHVEVDYLLGRQAVPKPSGETIQTIFRNAQEMTEDALQQLRRFSEFLKQEDSERRKPK